MRPNAGSLYTDPFLSRLCDFITAKLGVDFFHGPTSRFKKNLSTFRVVTFEVIPPSTLAAHDLKVGFKFSLARFTVHV